jgi:uncharacterized membrane protein
MLTGVKSNSALRATAREKLKGNWGKSILAVVIFIIISGIIGSVGSYKGIGWVLEILYFIIVGSWVSGILTYFLKLVRDESVSIKLLFSQLPRLFAFFKLYLLVVIYTLLWLLLLIVPGIIASFRYSLSFYIMIDNPEMTASQAINRSKEMMQGQKMKYFLLFLSFIGWYLLSIITLGIGFLWFIPYVYATQASFYEDLRIKYDAKQAVSNDLSTPTYV